MSISTMILVIGIAVILIGVGIFALFSSLTEGRDDDMQRYLASQKRAERDVQSRTNRPKKEPGIQGVLQSLNRNAGGWEENMPRSIEEWEKKMTPEGGMPWGKVLGIAIAVVFGITVIVNLASLGIDLAANSDDSSITIDFGSDENSGDDADVFDDDGNLIRHTETDWFGNKTSCTEYYADGWIRREESYENGRLWEAWEYADEEDGATIRYEDHTDSDYVWYYDYDEDGNVIHQEEYDYDVLSMSWDYEMDADGTILRTETAVYDSTGRLEARYIYEGDEERQIRSENYSGNGKLTDYEIMMYDTDSWFSVEDDSDSDIWGQILEGSYDVVYNDTPVLWATFDGEHKLTEVDVLLDEQADEDDYDFTTTDDTGTYGGITSEAELAKYTVEYGDDGFANAVIYTGE